MERCRGWSSRCLEPDACCMAARRSWNPWKLQGTHHAKTTAPWQAFGNQRCVMGRNVTWISTTKLVHALHSPTDGQNLMVRLCRCPFILFLLLGDISMWQDRMVPVQEEGLASSLFMMQLGKLAVFSSRSTFQYQLKKVRNRELTALRVQKSWEFLVPSMQAPVDHPHRVYLRMEPQTSPVCFLKLPQQATRGHQK